MDDPRIYLAIDNCFASKRWVAPAEWSAVIQNLGLTCVEASADVDCDPFNLPAPLLEEWVDTVRAVQAEQATRVVNLYSGHGTYVTLGLAHTDPRVRAHYRDDWLKPMIHTAAKLGAGMGFFCHAFSQSVLASPQRYAQAEAHLTDDLAILARYGQEVGAGLLGVEQMRNPHLPPWTIAGSMALLRSVHAASGVPFYLTVDVTHASGQSRCLRPSERNIAEHIIRARSGDNIADLWLGPECVYAAFKEMVVSSQTPDSGAAKLAEMLQDYPYLFAAPEDGDPYAWLRALAPYSPIIHLSQTTGHDAAHSAFTIEHNASGIIEPRRVLETIARAYASPEPEGLPPRCQNLYLTLEIFPPTVDTPPQIIRTLSESVCFWREHIPEDGLSLSEIVA